MFSKTRVKFRLKGSDEIQLGFLEKNKEYKNKYRVLSMDKKSGYCISLLDMLEKI